VEWLQLQSSAAAVQGLQILDSFAGKKLTLPITSRVPSAALPYEAEASAFYFRRDSMSPFSSRPARSAISAKSATSTTPMTRPHIGKSTLTTRSL